MQPCLKSEFDLMHQGLICKGFCKLILIRNMILIRHGTITVTNIKQERINQDRIEIGPFFDFLLHNSIFLYEILNIASQLSCEAMFKISSENVGENRRKDQFWSYLHCSFLA